MKPEGHEVIDEQLAEEVRDSGKRGPFRFSACGIPFGSEIVYAHDKKIKAIVIDDRHIEYDGKTTSLSALARELLGLDRTPQGPKHFKYQGEILSDLRNRLEGQK